MKTEIFKEELTKLLAKQAVQEMQLNAASQLTAVDIYVGDDHLRIACQVNAVDQIMEDVMQLIRIPGETIVCHEAIELDSSFVDYTKYPMCMNGRQLRYQLKKHFKLDWVYECVDPGIDYMLTSDLGFASEFAQIHKCQINKYLTRLCN
jgi:hypothetical protein